MAHYKMHTEIRSQCAAFVKGFHSLIQPSWLSFFSPKELQQIISGKDSELDINDLRYDINHNIVYRFVFAWQNISVRTIISCMKQSFFCCIIINFCRVRAIGPSIGVGRHGRVCDSVTMILVL